MRQAAHRGTREGTLGPTTRFPRLVLRYVPEGFFPLSLLALLSCLLVLTFQNTPSRVFVAGVISLILVLGTAVALVWGLTALYRFRQP